MIFNLLRRLTEPTETLWTLGHSLLSLSHYDAVLVYGCRDMFDAAREYDLTASADRIEYCGYVTTRTPPKLVSPPAEPFVLVTGGGGSDAFQIAHEALVTLLRLSRLMPIRGLVVTGPNMPVPQRTVLSRLAEGSCVRVATQVWDLPGVLARASVVVTMAGYNTLCEILVQRKKAIVVPRSGPSAEQRVRSELFAGRGLIRTIAPEAATSDRLAAELGKLLTRNDVPDVKNIPPLNGASRAAAILAETQRVLTGTPRDAKAAGGA